MKLLRRDLGRMDYGDCWQLQQTLFDRLLAGKRPRASQGVRNGQESRATQATRTTQGFLVEQEFRDAQGFRDDQESRTAQTFRTAQGPQAAQESQAIETVRETQQQAQTYRTETETVGTILFVEHPHVYTLGKSGHAENLLVGRPELERAGAKFFHIDRGGDITYHGPGQLVCYPILDLEALGIGLRSYIEALEEAVIRTVAHYGIRSERIAGASGVWITGPSVRECAPDEERKTNANSTPHAAEPKEKAAGLCTGCAPQHPATAARPVDADFAAATQLPPRESTRPRKICAIGVRSSRYITMHGFALNVTTDLGRFACINPCGFTDRGVTSIAAETGREVPLTEVADLVCEHLKEILNVKIYKYQNVCP